VSQQIISDAVSQKDNLIEQIFYILHQPGDLVLSASDVHGLISPYQTKLNPEIANLLASIQSVIKKGDQITINLTNPGKNTIQIAGFSVDLFAEQVMTATANPASLSLSSVKGLKAGMGLMKLELQGVQFKRDSGAFLVDLMTPMKTFTVKIAVI